MGTGKFDRSFLIKTFVMIVGLAGISAVIYFLMHSIRTGLGEPGARSTFFEQFVIDGGPIVWLVLLPLSLVTAYLAAEHFLSIRRSKLLPAGAGGEIAETIERFGLGQLEARLSDRSDLVSAATARAVGGGRGDWFRIRNLFAESLQDQASMLLRKIEWLNLIGNVSPMVGLFGTVYGMIKLFNTIVLAGGNPDTMQLAGGISVALVTTFWGLFIAIPAVAIHGVFANRIDAIVNDAVLEVERVMPEIRRALDRQKHVQASRPDQKSRPIREFAGKPRGTADEAMPSR